MKNSKTKKPPRRLSGDTQKERRLRRQIESLRADKKRYFEEMVARGEEVTCMIRVFLSVSSRLPAGPRERIEKLARRYAERNDSDRFVLNADFGRLDFFEEGRRGIKKIREERFNDKKYKIRV